VWMIIEGEVQGERHVVEHGVTTKTH
jgi:hypothetical protein